MTYVITEKCIDVADKACIEVCPVDCIMTSEADRMCYIDPDGCIDCEACVLACPVSAIVHESDEDNHLGVFKAVNQLWFKDRSQARSLLLEFLEIHEDDVSL